MNLNKLESSKSIKFRDFKRNFLIFLTKLASKFDFENVYVVLEQIKKGYTLNLYYNLLQSIQDIDDFLIKKLIIQQYCIIIGNFTEALGFDTCKAFTLILICALEQFYKMVNYLPHEKESLEIGDTYCSAIRSSFKLKTLIIPVKFF